MVTSGVQRPSATAKSTLLLAPSWLLSPATSTDVSSTTRIGELYVTSYGMSTGFVDCCKVRLLAYPRIDVNVYRKSTGRGRATL